MTQRLFTAEFVLPGHPDKVCDIVSDSVLDEILAQDPNGRAGVETFAPGKNTLHIGGEINTSAKPDIARVARKAVRDLGYTSATLEGLDSDMHVVDWIKIQSPDIAQGVDEGKGLHAEQGAGDQGMMFGYAINETPELMPLALSLARRVGLRLDDARQNGTISYIKPDGKTQVTLAYDNFGNPTSRPVQAVVVSVQHAPGVDHGQLVEDVKNLVIDPALEGLVTADTVYHVNPTGAFVLGGSAADAGLTGRKIIVDTYGSGSLRFPATHGGGAFSGKDPSKVDRSAAYMARYIAKNIVNAGLAHACQVQLAYAIGVAEPVSVNVNTFGTSTDGVTDDELAVAVRKVFGLKPRQIIDQLDLRRPIYAKTAARGHFGHEGYSWERTDKKDDLLKAVKDA
ncbi:methionine adenosyltransferase [Candidatus Woesearchaeota archaeon CG10_big_fil_rev_8_21_14_0_10_37_12]|nr:MAG: methionine adenosyltransferase [Candidatus Woesearchaeota archaeon CG10_big_fil_rev_8_21_14_0_10_37_12]